MADNVRGYWPSRCLYCVFRLVPPFSCWGTVQKTKDKTYSSLSFIQPEISSYMLFLHLSPGDCVGACRVNSQLSVVWFSITAKLIKIGNSLQRSTQLCLRRQRGNSVRLDWVHWSRWFFSWLQFYYQIRSDCKRERCKREAANRIVHGSGSHERTTTRMNPMTWQKPRQIPFWTRWKFARTLHIGSNWKVLKTKD